MSHRFCSVSNLSFRYPEQLDFLFDRLSFTLPEGWTGVVGENGAGKTSLARLILGELQPTEGSVRGPSLRHYCAQTTETVPDGLADLAEVPDAEAYRIATLLGIQYDWPYRWETLSFGERKRSQLGSALYLSPDMLVLDEPTNHLDIDGVKAVSRALAEYTGIGILISHDRALLDSLCGRCIFIESGSVIVRPGGVTQGLAEQERERNSVLHERREARRELDRLKAEASRRKSDSAAADARRSKKHLDRKDSDGRGQINLARVTGKDAVAGKLLRQMEHRLESATARVDQATVFHRPATGVTIGGTRSKRDLFFRCDGLHIPLGDGRVLSAGALEFSPRDRVAVVGPNGSGKSTLLEHLRSRMPDSSYLFMRQEISARERRQLAQQVAELGHARRGEVLSTVARLGSDPTRVLQTPVPSPGEARKLMIALGVAEELELLVLDEPTNHMDLPSVRCIEEALADTPASLLFVTHDAPLAERLATVRWKIEVVEGGSRVVVQPAGRNQ